MKPNHSWIAVVMGTVGIAGLAGSLVYFRWSRFEALQEIIARSHPLTDSRADQMEALISLATSETALPAERNRAIWALGELGDRSALPRLRELDRYETCDHDVRICVRELRKTLQKLD
jgi:hypothetical protein